MKLKDMENSELVKLVHSVSPTINVYLVDKPFEKFLNTVFNEVYNTNVLLLDDPSNKIINGINNGSIDKVQNNIYFSKNKNAKYFIYPFTDTKELFFTVLASVALVPNNTTSEVLFNFIQTLQASKKDQLVQLYIYDV